MSGAATAERNGSATLAEAVPPQLLPALPVDSYKEAAPLLRRPFTPEAVKFKVQATWDGGGLIVAYIDARLAIERLNLVCPHLWADKYEPTANGLMWCHLTIDEITRSDVGEGAKKGLISDALKRAAVHFGVGVSLYAIPKIRLTVDGGFLKADRRDKYKITPNGETRARQIYASWLDALGRKAFGDPLDHGDAPEAVGDADAESPPPTAGAPEGGTVHVLDREVVGRLVKGLGALKLSYREVNVILGAVGADGLRENSADGVMAALQALTLDQATAFEARLEAAAKDREAEGPQAGGEANAD